MGITATNSNLVPQTNSARGLAVVSGSAGTSRRRVVTPENGRAIEMLGHAIEYLRDEYALDSTNQPESSPRGVDFVTGNRQHDPRLAAIQLLMARNREIYLGCPEAPTLGSRLRALIRETIRGTIRSEN
jgi:hypothetical protein